MSRRLGVLLVVLALATVGAGAANAPRTDERDADSLTGRLLVATDDMRDPRFRGTVIFMVHHDATGAMGLVINRPLGTVPLVPLLERLGRDSEGVSGTIRVHYGGPVELGWGAVFHTADWLSSESRVVLDSVRLTADPTILDAIGRGQGPRRFLFVLGYAGWAPGQLESEMTLGAWVSVPADEALLFDEDTEGKWERAMARRRIDL
jgi:putative transcriptional regulator